MFYQGTLQDGISLAVNEAKAVICFVREDTEACEQWENGYFGDDEFARSLEAKSVILRLTAGSQEAGFLASLCPLVKFPAAVVIKNGSLREYLVPEISKDDFRARLTASLEDSNPPGQINPPQQNGTGVDAAEGSAQPAPVATLQPVAPAAPPQPQREPETTRTRQASGQPSGEDIKAGKRRVESVEESKHDDAQRDRVAASFQQQKEERLRNIKRAMQEKKDSQKKKSAPTAPSGSVVDHSKEGAVQPKAVPTPPKQCRLQVRLFDGSSVRSSFSPSKTIRKDVRAWLDEQLTDDTNPYNLKHILTPLPNRTLSVAEEDKSLEELGLGPSANLVMVPVPSYAQAYSTSAVSLPVRAVSSVCNLLFSAASSVSGVVGSFLGYGAKTPSEDHSMSPTGSPPAHNRATQRSHPAASRGPIIRTLRDQREERDDHQLYNGNQLNFEPRKDSDGEQG